jgi:uncharacterized protein (UPF0261 family)
MVNFGPWDTVPERFKNRRLYRHNPTVTLMRTTVDGMPGDRRLPRRQAERDDRPGALPHSRRRGLVDRPARPALSTIPRPTGRLFETIAQRFRAGADRKLIRLPLNINDEAFADALVAAWREVAASAEQRQPLSRPAHAPHR